MLAESAELLSDGDVYGRYVGGVRNVIHPLQGAAELEVREHELNGLPVIMLWRGEQPFATCCWRWMVE